MLSAAGYPHERIRRVIRNPNTDKPIDSQTLVRAFRPELEEGKDILTAQVAHNVVRAAVLPSKEKRPPTGPEITAAIFWLKARAGFRDRPDPGQFDDVQTVGDIDAGPDLRGMSDADLDAYLNGEMASDSASQMVVRDY